MLTVCIPVYNSDVSQLLEGLLKQQTTSKFPIEIVVIDDGSKEEIKKINSRFSSIITYVENEINQGRARIRNQFLQYASMPFLLFIDGDSQLISTYFLADYCEFLFANPDSKVVCGASIYQKEQPSRNYLLRWKYSTVRESKSLAERLKNLNLGFKTNNFVIAKSVFQNVKFNETLTGYGHEDTLFGFELRQNEISIQHLENPVLNKNLDDNQTFLLKTDEGLKSLLKVLSIVENNPQFIEEIKILRVYLKLNKSPFFGFGMNLSGMFLPLLKFLLRNGFFTLFLFDSYKLLTLNRLNR